MLKALAARLPVRAQQELKRLHFSRQIAAGTFITEEPEYPLLGSWVRPGDWVIDVGANIGHYTQRLSDLVGPSGHVFAFEPLAPTFELLAANMARAKHQNITLINAAASDSRGLIQMSLPRTDGVDNYYRASVAAGGDIQAMALPVDSIGTDHRIAFIKIDVEGHEAQAVAGMAAILELWKPTLIIEGACQIVEKQLTELGYGYTQLLNSPNRIYRHEIV